MKQIVFSIFLLTAVLQFQSHACAAYMVSQSVVGNGGGRITSAGNVVLGTAGQPAVGPAHGPAYGVGGGYWYQPTAILAGVGGGETGANLRFNLDQNRPNPFGPVTMLQFSVPTACRVTIRLYDPSGREVVALVDQELAPGDHKTVLDGTGLASGMYFCRMQAGAFVQTRKLVVLK